MYLRVITFACVLASLTLNAAAQTVSVAQMSGTVVDESGGALPGAEVKATQTATGASRFVITNATGEYVLPNLPVGPYRLDVTLAGFQTYSQTGIVLQVGANPVLKVTLKIGELSETVVVEADAAMVNTRNTSVGQVVDEQQIVNLPLNGRQPTQLILLSGAAVEANTGGIVGSQRQYPTAVAISVAGGAGNATVYLVDGGYNNDPLANISQPLPFPDALQEFKVESGVRQARYGVYPGATVNAVTKSGTNAFHGTAFGFLRDHNFNAVNPISKTSDGLKRVQWGGTLSGPVISNKLHFFGGLQVTRVRVNPTDTTAFVPTQAMLNGDFTQIASSACTGGAALNLPAPFVNNRVNPALFSPIALNLMKFVPVSTDPCGRTSFAVPDNNDEQIGVGRLDFQMTDKQRLFARYMIANYDRPAAFDGSNVLLGSGNGLGLDNRVQTAVIADDYALSSSVFSSTRFAIAKSRILRAQGANMPTFTSLGSQMTTLVPEEGLAFFNLSVTNGFPGLGFPGRFNSMTYQVSQDFDWVKGSHQLAFGGMWVRPILDAYGPFQANGVFTFNGSRAGAGRLGLADLLLGVPSAYRQGGIQDVQQYQNYVGIYAQDTWRVGNHLTVNAGLRWEPYLASIETEGYASNFSLDRFLAGQKSTVIPNAPAGLTFAGDEGFPGDAYNNNNIWQFAPRLGVVWDPTGDGRQTIRAAGGVFYESPKMWQYGRFPLNPPFGNTVTVNNPSFANPWATTAGGDPFRPGAPQSFPLNGSFVNMPLDIKPTRMVQWNVSYERQFWSNWMIGLNYIGNYSTHLWLGRELNPATYIPGASTVGNTNSRRYLVLTNPTEGRYFADVPTADDRGTGKYNGLLVSLNRRMSNHWSLLSNFTWSKCINDGDPGIDITNFYPDPNDPKSNRGPCNSDRRYMYNGSVILQSPGVGSGLARAATEGWQLATIVQARSGASFTPSMTGDLALTGTNNQRPIVTGDPSALSGDQSRLNWFNKAAFVANSPGVWGSATRGMIRGPMYMNVDMSLTRSFKMGATRRLEVRAEAFNVFNRFQLGDPVVNFNATTFGTIITAMPPRVMQFAAKFEF
jgi:hypothetical protein